jgi:hypothetical protein
MIIREILKHLYIKKIDEIDLNNLSTKEIKVWKISKTGSLAIALIGYALISVILMPFRIGLAAISMFFGDPQVMSVLGIFILLHKSNRYMWYHIIHLIANIVINK